MIRELLGALAAIALMVLTLRYAKGRRWERPIVLALCVGYFLAVCWITLFWDARAGVVGTRLLPRFPFIDAIRARSLGMTGMRSLLNVLLFVPLGYLLCVSCATFGKRTVTWWMSLAAGLLLSLLIESSQLLLHRGVFELDDLVKNTLGSGLGHLLFRRLERPRRTGPAGPDTIGRTGEEEMKDLDFRLVMCLLRAGMTGETPDLDAFAEHWEEISVKRVAEIAARHDVVLTVYLPLGSAELPFFAQLKRALRLPYGPSLAKTIEQDGEGQVVLDALERAGIDHMPLKGWVMRSYYADPLSRSMMDLDILVRNYRYEQIRSVMQEAGYRSNGSSPWKHDGFLKEPYMNVEIHKRLTDSSGKIRAWENGVWERSVPVQGTEHRSSMSEEDLYIFHLVHMYKDFKNGALGLRRVADLWLLRRKMDASCVAGAQARLAQMGLGLFAERMAELAAVCFDGKAADPDCETLLRFMAGGAVFTDPQRHKLGRMASSAGGHFTAAKLRAIRDTVFLPVERMRAQFPILERWPILLPACWLKRALRAAAHPVENLRGLDYSGLSKEQYEEMCQILRAGGVLADGERPEQL